MKSINKVKYNKNIRIPLNDDELEMVRYTEMSLRDKAIVEVLYSTGCRVSELSDMNITDINFKDREILIRHGKGDKQRIVYLNPASMVALNAYLKSRTDSSDALFVSMRKPYDRIKTRAIETIVKSVSKKANVRSFSPHVIRHTTATNALRRGTPIDEIKEMLGHEDISTTLIYAKQDRASVKRSHNLYVV